MSNDVTEHEFSGYKSLMAIANRIPKAKERPIYWNDPNVDREGKVQKMEDHKAVYNPSSGELYNVVTDSYQIIQPPQFIGPFVSQLKERGRSDAWGVVKVFDGGSHGYGEVLFDTDAFWPPDRTRNDEPVRTGVTFRWSHDGGVSVRASGWAQDGMCKNTMRNVTDAVYVKHAGDVGDRIDWDAEWQGVLSQLGVFSETLASVIEESMNYEMFDLAEGFDREWLDVEPAPDSMFEEDGIYLPTGIAENHARGFFSFYRLLGFPVYLSREATARLCFRLGRSENPRNVHAWHVYSAMTYALTHVGRFDSGTSTDDKYQSLASDILMNPPMMLDEARQTVLSRLQADDEMDSETFAVEQTVGEALLSNERYEERMAELRGSLSRFEEGET